MTTIERSEMEQHNRRRLWIVATLSLVVLALVVRFYINFSHRYPPGVNAAYYAVQTRSWLAQGRLMSDDLPLIFWLDAALSRALVVAGLPLDDAVLLATRIVDSLFEPWAAAFIMGFGYVWSGGQRTALVGCLATSTFLVLSPPIMRMLSDFEKNSLGLVVICAALWVCRFAMINRGVSAWLLLCVLVAIAALTHVGAFAVTMTLVVTALLLWGVLSLRRERLATVFALAAAGTVVSFAVLASFDAHREQRLVQAPAALFANGSFEAVLVPIMIIAMLLIAVAIRVVWRDRHTLPGADIAIVIAAAVTLVILGPPKSYVYFNRLMLMAPVPASLLLAFIIARSVPAGIWAGVPLLLIASYAAATGPAAVQPALISPEVVEELKQIRRHIPDPDSTLVVAAHGFEWWAGYILRTPVRSAIPSHDYRRVLLLRNTVDCPPEVVSPFAAPPIGDAAQKLYLGRCVEVYQAQ